MKSLPDRIWKRHANPWSVWTRFAAIPLFVLAVWSRVWFGWWALAPVGLVVIWLFANTFVFPPVEKPRAWASKGIYGEQLWLSKKSEIPHHYAVIQQWLIILGLVGMIMIAVGLVLLHSWLCILGIVILTLAQLWRIDRFSTLYEHLSK